MDQTFLWNYEVVSVIILLTDSRNQCGKFRNPSYWKASIITKSAATDILNVAVPVNIEYIEEKEHEKKNSLYFNVVGFSVKKAL